MKKIAITGNIASGKSTVCEIIEDMGFLVVGTDELGREALASPAVTNAFSEYDVFDDSGLIDRSKLSKLVFSDDELREKLNSIVHPMIFAKLEEFLLQHSDESAVFVEIPLLFETKSEGQFDVIILVYAEDDVRLSRLMARDGFSEEEAEARMQSQESQRSKLKKTNYIVDNSGEDGYGLYNQIYEVLTRI